MQDVLAQAVAVFAPERISEQIDELQRSAESGQESDAPQTPLCQADFERLMGRAGKGSE